MAASRLLFWAPRILSVGFALFLAVFALDELSPDRDFLTKLFAVTIHLLPSTILVLVVVRVAWRHDLIGAVGFTALAVAYVALTWGRSSLLTYMAIAGPLLAAGALFLASWIVGRTHASGPAPALQR